MLLFMIRVYVKLCKHTSMHKIFKVGSYIRMYIIAFFVYLLNINMAMKHYEMVDIYVHMYYSDFFIVTIISM